MGGTLCTMTMFSSFQIKKLSSFRPVSAVVWPVIAPSRTDQMVRSPCQPSRVLPSNSETKPGPSHRAGCVPGTGPRSGRPGRGVVGACRSPVANWIASK
jgi:hypothetical protein